jgi:hypothetical protein
MFNFSPAKSTEPTGKESHSGDCHSGKERYFYLYLKGSNYERPDICRHWNILQVGKFESEDNVGSGRWAKCGVQAVK